MSIRNLRESKHNTCQKGVKYKCTICGRNKFDSKQPHKCVGGFRKSGFVWEVVKNELQIEIFGACYVLDTYLDFASEAKEDFVQISIDEVRNIIKLLKQVSV